MFKSKKNSIEEPIPNLGKTSLIAKGMVITGDIATENDVRIDGKLIGNIKSTARVVIGNDGRVEGNIFAFEANITGSVKGNITTTELVTLRDTAVVEGDMQASKINIEPSASYNGNCRMLHEEPTQIVAMKKEKNDKKQVLAEAIAQE
ncbi:polymer-forming cytoskeletal protein [Chitinophagaceae bacterium LWZ2-11]